MRISRHAERFIHRTLVLAFVAIAMGIGVVVAKESQEIQKLIEDTLARDLLFIFGPLAGLAITGYSLASRSFSSGGILGEFLLLGGAYSLFLAVALPSFFKRAVATPEGCKFWQLFCDDTLSVRDYRISLFFGFMAIVLFIFSLVRAFIPNLRKS